MNQYQIEARKSNGKEIAERFKILMKDGMWRVTSSKSPRKSYEVCFSPTNVSCTCPDHAATRGWCKHIYAVEHILRGGDDPPEPEDTPPPGPKRPTYPRDFAKINAAQTTEEDEFEPLLYNLCQTIPQPEHRRGRRPVPIGDAVFAVVSKVYMTKSARRVIPRLRVAHERGHLQKPVKFNTISSYLEKEELTEILLDLIIKSNLPLVSLETVFAIDSTGIVGSRFVRWTDIKYRGLTEHVWAKVHLMCGVKTHIVTAATIGERNASDLVQLPDLLRTTAKNFNVREVLGDIAYNTVENQKEVDAIGAEAFFPFKKSHSGRRGGIWREKYLQWRDDYEYFSKHYHQRSNVESVMMMIKSKFGDAVRSKTETAMRNEVYCKLICHNIYCLIMAMHRLDIGAGFMAASFQKEAAD